MTKYWQLRKNEKSFFSSNITSSFWMAVTKAFTCVWEKILARDGAQRENHWFQFTDAELNRERISELLQTSNIKGHLTLLQCHCLQTWCRFSPLSFLQQNVLLELVHQLGRGSQLAVPGPLPSDSIKNCFHDYSAYAKEEQALGRMFIWLGSFIWLRYLLIACIEELSFLVAD